MPYAQFMAIPPLLLVKAIFAWYADCSLEIGSHWSFLKSGIAPGLSVIKPYIRPSHSKLLLACEGGGCPLAFLRQILRPHGFTIKTLRHGYRVEGIDTETTPVKRIAGTDVTWD